MKIEEIWKILEDGFGDAFEPTDEETKTTYVKRSKEALDIGLEQFKENCNSINFNGMLFAIPDISNKLPVLFLKSIVFF